jgi:fructosamine-3-kinase
MTLAARIAAASGAGIRRLTPLHGGDLSEVARADLADGRVVVAKTGVTVAAEARMLRAMAAAGAPVPEVRHAEPGLVLLDHLDETPATPAGWRALGAALARLHAARGPAYGWHEDHAFGAVAVPNGWRDDWPDFWAEARLRPALPDLPADVATRVEALCRELPGRLPAAPPASLLHGDIWAGNALFSGDRAYLIDPACYHGDAEVDLAMLTLFGNPPRDFFAGYGPLRAGHDARRPVYQLWPALVHVRLFGAGYLGLVRRLLDGCGV